MPDPFEELESEHRIIESVLDALESSDDAGISFYEGVVAFIRAFADGVHHEKEERVLFPALEARGVLKEMGPIGVMVEEHELGRAHVATMTDLIAARDLAGLQLEGRAYAALLRSHIEKEEQALFMIGRSVLSPNERDAVARGFADVERDQGAPDDTLVLLEALRG